MSENDTPRAAASARIDRDGDRVVLHDLVVDDPALASLLAAHPSEAPEEIVRRALAVGARGLLSMGLGVDLEALDRRVHHTLEAVVEQAGTCAREAIEAARESFDQHLDPDRRSSYVAATLDRFSAARDALLAQLDPDRADAHTARFIADLERILGPGGLLQSRLEAALDPDGDGPGLAALGRLIDRRFTELAAVVGREEGRVAEADLGTRKGIGFEDVVEARLRDLALGMGGCSVERTGRVPGEAGGAALVGDFVVTLPGEHRIVVEAKDTAGRGLRGKNGILAELDRAMENRRASFAVCVSRGDAFPREVGAFGVYGDRVLVVDDGDGHLLGAALRWARAAVERSAAGGEGLDTDLVRARLGALADLATRFESSKRALTVAQTSLESVKGDLSTMRSDLVSLVDDIVTEIRRTDPDDGSLRVA